MSTPMGLANSSTVKCGAVHVLRGNDPFGAGTTSSNAIASVNVRAAGPPIVRAGFFRYARGSLPGRGVGQLWPRGTIK